MPVEKSYLLNEPSMGPVPSQVTLKASTLTPAEIAANVAEDWDTCRALRAPVRRVCMPAVPVPFSPPLEDFVLPDQARIASTVRDVLGYA